MTIRELLNRMSDGYWWLHRVRPIWAFVLRTFVTTEIPAGQLAKVIWLMRLVSKEDAGDWEATQRQLTETLRSISRQANADIEVVICGHDRPRDLECRYPVHFVEAPRNLRKIGGVDSQAKLRLAAQHICRTFDGLAYVVFSDADDVAHPDLAAFVAGDANGRGYLITEGWMWNTKERAVVPVPPEPGGLSFDKVCGSCVVVAVDLGRSWLSRFLLTNNIHQRHQLHDVHFRQIGHPLDPVPFPAMLYVTAHGDNTSLRTGRGDVQHWLLQNWRVDGDPANAVLREFGVLDGPTAGSATSGN